MHQKLQEHLEVLNKNVNAVKEQQRFVLRHRYFLDTLAHFEKVNSIGSAVGNAWQPTWLMAIMPVNSFTSVHEPQLMEVLQYIEDYFAREVVSSDQPQLGYRYYDIRDDGTLIFRLIAVLQENGLCKRVRVGKRPIDPLPLDDGIYEFVCE